MCRILIFGGTTEGRELAEFCGENNVSAYLSVATDYGAAIVDKADCLHILKGRMDSGDIAEFISSNGIESVFDATHPYAVEVTKNIRTACENTGAEYIRIKREENNIGSNGEYFNDLNLIIDYLKNTEGRILVTTGSKELKKFCVLENFMQRCAVRVLPGENIIGECERLGFKSDNIIAEKGPFSEEQNIDLIQKYNVKYLVTKESGTAGGFEAKVRAAEKCGVRLLIVKRPFEKGITVSQAEKILLTEA